MYYVVARAYCYCVLHLLRLERLRKLWQSLVGMQRLRTSFEEVTWFKGDALMLRSAKSGFNYELNPRNITERARSLVYRSSAPRATAAELPDRCLTSEGR